MGVHHVPGSGTLVARGRTVLFTGTPLSRPAVERVWALLADDSVDQTTSVLAALGADAPADLVVLFSGSPAAFTARGSLPLSPSHESTLLVRLSVGAVPDLGWPLEAGVVAAGGFTWTASVTPETVPPPPVSPAVLIDGIPDFFPSAAPPPVPVPVLDPVPDAEESLSRTVRRTSGPSVSAVACPAGHLNPTESETCRVCGVGVPAQEPRSVPRPPLGRLVLPDGSTLTLDRGAVFGRLPVATADNADAHLVDVASHGHHLSRMHLELVVEGWFVLARDLGSRGGSFLLVPGRPREQLRAHELVTVPPGSVLSLAGDYHFRYEVAS